MNLHHMWTTLQAALGHVNNAAFELGRVRLPADDVAGTDALEAGLVWLEDTRRALGELALALSDVYEGVLESHRRLAEQIVAPPRTAAEAAYIERVHRAES